MGHNGKDECPECSFEKWKAFNATQSSTHSPGVPLTADEPQATAEVEIAQPSPLAPAGRDRISTLAK